MKLSLVKLMGLVVYVLSVSNPCNGQCEDNYICTIELLNMTSDGGPKLRRAIDSVERLWSIIIERLVVASTASGPFLQRIGVFSRSVIFEQYHDPVFQLPADTIIEELAITGANPLRSFVAAKNENLKSLSIEKCSLDRIPTTLANMPALSRIFIEECALTVVRMDAFAGASALESVELNRNKIRQLLPATSSSARPLPIVAFSAEANLLERVDMAVFASMPQLEVLRLRSNRIVTLQASLPVTLPNLFQLRIELNDISTFDLGQLTLPRIGVLILEQNAFQDIPTNWPKMPELESLSIQQNNLKEANLTSLRAFPNLQSLFLDDNQITTVQVKEPLRLPLLDTLSISKNKLTSVNFSKLDLPVIYYIELAYNQLKAIPPLFQRYPNASLSISNNPLPCSAIQPLKNRIVERKLYVDSVFADVPCKTTSSITIDKQEKVCCNV